MNEESGTVVGVDGSWAWVETERSSACGSCAARSGCGTAVLSKVIGRRMTRVRAINRAEAVPGDRVTIAISDGELVRGSLLVYGLPLVLMITAAIAGDGMTPGETGPVLMGLAGLAAGFGWLRFHAKRISRDPARQPVITRLL